jgi:hypothetical protein
MIEANELQPTRSLIVEHKERASVDFPELQRVNGTVSGQYNATAAVVSHGETHLPRDSTQEQYQRTSIAHRCVVFLQFG